MNIYFTKYVFRARKALPAILMKEGSNVSFKRELEKCVKIRFCRALDRGQMKWISLLPNWCELDELKGFLCCNHSVISVIKVERSDYKYIRL